MWFVFLLCVIAAFADVLGGALTVFKRLKEHEILVVTGLGAGFLLGATVLDRLPDSMHELPTAAPVYIILGYLALLLVERYGIAHHHGATSQVDRAVITDSSILSPTVNPTVNPTMSPTVNTSAITPPTPSSRADPMRNASEPLMQPQAALISFVGLLFHTFMDGVIIAGAFSISRSTGILIFFAIVMHKIPEGFSMATISLAAGTSRWRAFLTSGGLAVSTIIGAIVTLEIGTVNAQFVKILMALATGTFLFVSTTDMIPAIKDKRISGTISVLIGVAIFYVSLLLIKHVGLS